MKPNHYLIQLLQAEEEAVCASIWAQDAVETALDLKFSSDEWADFVRLWDKVHDDSEELQFILELMVERGFTG